MASWCDYDGAMGVHHDIMSSVEYAVDSDAVTYQVAESLAAHRGSTPQGSFAVMSMRARA